MVISRAETERCNDDSSTSLGSTHGEDYEIFEYSSAVAASAKQKKTSQFTRNSDVQKCIDNLTSDLSKKENYDPIFICDKYSGFERPANDGYRFKFRRQLKASISKNGLRGLSVCLHIYSRRGSRPDFLSIFKVSPPSFRNTSANADSHMQNFISAIDQCRKVFSSEDRSPPSR